MIFFFIQKNCRRSEDSENSIALTRYFYDRDKIAEPDIKPEELFMAADAEINKNKKMLKH
ncbi:MAG TPA: hypothetical protein VHZ50_12740 [Puia sp.]|nr:hypothetical protein [Puia sp.]